MPLPPRRLRQLGLAAVALIALAVAVLSLAPRPSHAADLTATPATLDAVFARAQPGDVIHLGPGAYGTFRGGAKPGMVTLLGDPGYGASIVPELDGASNIRFQALTVGATSVVHARAIQFVGDRFTGMTHVDGGGDAPDAGILVDSSTFLGIDKCSSCYEGRLSVTGKDNAQPVGVTISNNHFGGGGESDGVQILGGANGVRVIGNEFDHFLQGDFETHVDPLQLYGSSHTVIEGNYFHDNDTGIMAPDGADHEVIEDNLFGARSNGYPWPIVLGSDVGSAIVHNTMVDGPCEFNLRCGTLRVDAGNAGRASRGTVVRDNVFTAWTDTQGSTVTEDHNLVVHGGGHGAGDVTGRPVYVGGGASWANFLLAPASPGRGAASDRSDMGILPAGGGSGAAPSAGGGDASAAAAAPSVAIVRPRPGAALGRRTRVVVRAHAAVGLARVQLWLGAKRRATLRRGPYRRTLRVPANTRTVSVRARGRDGRTSSAAVSVRRASAAHGSRRSAGWRIGTRPSARGTVVGIRGPAHRRATIVLTRCASRSGRAAQRLRVRPGPNGRARVIVRAGGLCAVGLSA